MVDILVNIFKSGTRCPDCDIAMFVHISHFYAYRDGTPKRYYRCPQCRGTHAADREGKPLGVPGDKETRRLRMAVHNAFDPLWKSGKEAYRWLAAKFGRKPVHMASMTAEECRQTLEILHAYSHPDLRDPRRRQHSIRIQ